MVRTATQGLQPMVDPQFQGRAQVLPLVHGPIGPLVVEAGHPHMRFRRFGVRVQGLVQGGSRVLGLGLEGPALPDGTAHLLAMGIPFQEVGLHIAPGEVLGVQGGHQSPLRSLVRGLVGPQFEKAPGPGQLDLGHQLVGLHQPGVPLQDLPGLGQGLVVTLLQEGDAPFLHHRGPAAAEPQEGQRGPAVRGLKLGHAGIPGLLAGQPFGLPPGLLQHPDVRQPQGSRHFRPLIAGLPGPFQMAEREPGLPQGKAGPPQGEVPGPQGFRTKRLQLPFQARHPGPQLGLVRAHVMERQPLGQPERPLHPFGFQAEPLGQLGPGARLPLGPDHHPAQQDQRRGGHRHHRRQRPVAPDQLPDPVPPTGGPGQERFPIQVALQILRQELGAVIPAVGLLLQALEDDGLQVLGQPGVQRPGPGRLLVHDHHEQLVQ